MITMARCFVAISLCACTTGSPLTRVVPQVELHTNPGNVAGQPLFSLSLTTWNDLDVLHDAIESGEIVATLDASPLVIEPGTTGYFGQHDSFVATFALPGTRSTTSPGATSQVTISDGQETWSVEIAQLFANDLQAPSPVTPGPNTFVWPSATSSTPYSLIDWACVEIAGQAEQCGGYEIATPALAVSQQYITADLTGAPGTAVTVTAERSANTSTSGDGPAFLTRILDRLETTL